MTRASSKSAPALTSRLPSEIGTPNLRAGYQSYFSITQGPDVVALRTEMIHDTRIFQIGAGPHVSSAIRDRHPESPGGLSELLFHHARPRRRRTAHRDDP